MDAVLNLLVTLGVDETVFYQFGIFVIAYFPLKLLVFKPYFEAYKERLRRTEGNQQLSEQFLGEADELKDLFEQKTREVNAEYKAIYDKSRTETMKSYEEKVQKARAKAKADIDVARGEIGQQFEKSRTEISNQIPNISEQIVGKMLQ